MNKVAQYAHTAQVLSKSQSKKDLEFSGLSDNEQSADFWKHMHRLLSHTFSSYICYKDQINDCVYILVL